MVCCFGKKNLGEVYHGFIGSISKEDRCVENCIVLVLFASVLFDSSDGTQIALRKLKNQQLRQPYNRGNFV